ncbi:EscU/YscU/HrcU family type III secretion system export apparatus switch protein [Ralstonia solanacearum]|nr:EscU/YscU/HrcU family type III secretion system export apparatus switch protein [Ralstonia solanacearum]
MARALYRVDLYGAVPEALFETVAEVLAWVGEMGAPGAEPQH